jgi:hypothetical protein
MTLRLRQLSLRVASAEGPMGTDIEFAPGLVVLRADNSTGKSTALQSVVFALGLEGMLGPSHAIPLPHAMTHRVTDPDGREVPVLESSVLLEIENSDGDVVTLRRYPKHDNVDSNLVTVFESRALTENEWGHRTDYFVRLPGAAQRERGFHRWLAQFLGWTLPEVPRFNAAPSPLYLETIFPLFIVEQKRGWAGVLSRVPTHFQIRNAARRAVEFVLRLEGSDLALERQRLEAEAHRITGEWQAQVARAEISAREAGGVVQDLPSSPVAAWPPAPAPSVLVPVGQQWHTLDVEYERVAEELEALRDGDVPEAEEAAPELRARLHELSSRLQEMGELYDSIQSDLAMDVEEVDSIRERRARLREELRRTQDAIRLRELGSPLHDWLHVEECPTCHQHLPEILLATIGDTQLVSLEEAERRTREQIGLVEALERDLAATIQAKRLRGDAVDSNIVELQGAVRSVKQTLVGPAGLPSVAHIHHMVELERRQTVLTSTTEALRQVTRNLGPLAEEWRGVQGRLSELRNVDLAQEDETKLARLEAILIEQLRDYGFRSLPAGEIRISRERYTPTHEGFDLGFDVSASDMIRLIWAYSIGLLEVAREFDTNHARLLLLDEPRQQSTDPVAFKTLLRRASTAQTEEQQVVFATSEPEASVREMLEGVQHKFIAYEGFILKPL